LITRRFRPNSNLLAFCVGLFLVLAPARPEANFRSLNPLHIATFGLTEPLAYGLGAFSLYLYLKFLQEESTRDLSLSLLCAGLAASARFQMLSLVVAEVAVTLFVLREPSLWRRSLLTFRAAIIGISPLIVGELLEVLVFHEHSGDPWRHHGSAHVLRDLLQWLFGGLFGTTTATVLTLATVAVCLVVLVGHRRRPEPGPTRVLVWWAVVLLAYVVLQVGLLWATRTFQDATLDIDQRTIGPAQLGLYLMLVTLVCLAGNAVRPESFGRTIPKAVRTVGSIAIAAGVLVAAVVSSEDTTKMNPVPPEASALRTYPGTVLVSNDPPELYLLTGRASLLIPVQRFLMSNELNTRFSADLDDMTGLLTRCGGELVIMPEFVADESAIRVVQAVGRLGTTQSYPDGIATITIAQPSTAPYPACPHPPK
jgi:hypothetical protein